MFDNFISPQLETFPLLRVKKTDYPKLSIGDTLRGLTHDAEVHDPAILIEECKESRSESRSSDIP